MEKKKIILDIATVIIAILTVLAVAYGIHAIIDHFNIFGESTDKFNARLTEENAAGKFFRGSYFSHATNTNDLNEVSLKEWINDYLQGVNNEQGTNYTVSSVWETSEYWVIVVKDFAFFTASKNTGEVRFLDYNEEMKRMRDFVDDYNEGQELSKNLSKNISNTINQE